MDLTIAASPELISGYLLALSRCIAWIAISPPFSNRSIPLQVKAGFAAALTLAIGPKVAEQGVPLEVGPLVTAIALQVAVGVILGFIGVLVFAAVQAAGDLVDLVSGLGMAQMFDPMSGTMASVFGRLYQLMATTLLFAVDGHIVLVRGFLTSFEAAPLTGFSMGALSKVLTEDAGLLLLAAIEIAAPLLGALVLAEFALGLLARVAPQMNVFLVGMPAKILLTLALAGLAVPLVPGAVRSLLDVVVRQGLGVVG